MTHGEIKAIIDNFHGRSRDVSGALSPCTSSGILLSSIYSQQIFLLSGGNPALINLPD